MGKVNPFKKNGRRRQLGKENAEPESLNNSLLENILGDNINDIVGRRSDVGKRSLLIDADESITDVDINDDDLEKEERRKAEERERESRAAAAASSKESGFGLLNKLSQAELDEHYSKCIELCNRNKVNVKNAFKLQLIDYMKLIVSNQSTKSENLTLMSCTLGASAKIYALRVDKVYTDMVKILSGKGSEVEKEEDSDGENAGNEGEDANDLVPKKRRRTTSNSSDEEGDDGDSNIDMNKMLLSEAQLDKNKGEQEPQEKEGLPRGLEFFVECRQLDPDGRISLNPPLFPSSNLEKPSRIATVSIDEQPYGGDYSKLNICDYIQDYKDMKKCFSIIGEGEEDDESPELMNSSLAFDPSSNIDISDAIRIDAEEKELECGDAEPWAPDYDEDSDCSDKETKIDEKSGQVSIGQRRSFNPEAMARLVSTESGDYSYFDNSRIDFFAGPRHWSIKRSKGGEKIQKPAAEPSKKTVKKTANIEFVDDKTKDVKKYYSDIVHALLNRKTIIGWSVRRCKIPQAVSYTQKKMLSLMKTEGLLFVKKDSGTNMICSGDLKNEEEPLLNPEDFEADVMDHDEDEDDLNRSDGSLSLPDERPPSPPIHMDIDSQAQDDDSCTLVPAPQKVSKLNLKFAKAQKKIDIKLLKNVMWDTMALEPKNGRKVNFSEVYSKLPKKLPSEEAAQLSLPIAFMALLHMANEKTLELRKTDHNDVQVGLG